MKQKFLLLGVGVLFLTSAFVFGFVNENPKQPELSSTSQFGVIKTTMNWEKPVSQEFFVVKPKTSFSAVPTERERGNN